MHRKEHGPGVEGQPLQLFSHARFQLALFHDKLRGDVIEQIMKSIQLLQIWSVIFVWGQQTFALHQTIDKFAFQIHTRATYFLGGHILKGASHQIIHGLYILYHLGQRFVSGVSRNAISKLTFLLKFCWWKLVSKWPNSKKLKRAQDNIFLCCHLRVCVVWWPNIRWVGFRDGGSHWWSSTTVEPRPGWCQIIREGEIEGAEDNGWCVRPSSCLTPSQSTNGKPTLKPKREWDFKCGSPLPKHTLPARQGDQK